MKLETQIALQELIIDALAEIREQRERLNRMERWLAENRDKLEGVHQVSTSLMLSKPSLYLRAGQNPVEVARRFKAQFTARSHYWQADLPDFYLTFLEAEVERAVSL